MKNAAIVLSILAIPCLNACMASKVVTLPAKAAYNTVKVAGKGVYYSGYYAGKGVYYLGKGVYKTGQGAYYVGMVPVRVFDGALDRADRVVVLTGNVIDTANKAQKFAAIVTIDGLEDQIKAIQELGEITDVILKRASNGDARKALEAGLIDKVDGSKVEMP